MSLYWRRIRPGAYISLANTQYEVGKAVSGEWYYEGPGLDGIAETKHAAQAECEQHHKGSATP